MHAASVNGSKWSMPVPLMFEMAVLALVGHPIPLSHVAWTRYVLPGSKSAGWTWWKFPGGSVVGGGGRRLSRPRLYWRVVSIVVVLTVWDCAGCAIVKISSAATLIRKTAIAC